MSDYDKTIRSIIDSNNGHITASQVTQAGIPRRHLSKMLSTGDIYRVDRGIYALPEAWEDELHALQYRYNKGIFSHGTALFLHGLSDRTPHKYTMTFPHGYNTSGVKGQGIIAKLSSLELYDIGVTQVQSACGNPIKVYDVERTLCDIVRGKNEDDVQLVNHAMKAYAASKTKDIAKLVDFAEKFHVRVKILKYMGVLL